jgi:DNA-binding response OmpR family regulator
LPAEVLARVRSQLRRYTKLGGFSPEKEMKITYGNNTVDAEEKTVFVDEERISLTPTEFEILKLLIQNPGVIFSPKEIYRRIWNDSPYGAEGTVAVHIRRLREKIEITPAEPRYLKTIWGQGYRIEKHVGARKDKL